MLLADIDITTITTAVIAVMTMLGGGIAASARWVFLYLKDRAEEQRVFLTQVFDRFEGLSDKHAAAVDKIHLECAAERKDAAAVQEKRAEQTSQVLSALSGSVAKLSSRIDAAYPPKANRRDPEPEGK